LTNPLFVGVNYECGLTYERFCFMNIEELGNKNSFLKTIISHFLIWFLYFVGQLWWRFDSYGIYTLIAAFVQVMSWAILFYTVRIYIYPRYLWKNHYKLAFASLLVYIIFQLFTIGYADFLISLEKTPPLTLLKHIKRGTFWYFNMSFLAFGFTYYDELGKEKLKNQITETQLAETKVKLRDAELENLKAQLNPHFLFNVIWYIIVLIQDTGNQKAVRAMQILHDMMRYSMNSRTVAELVPLKEELKYAKDFIDLQILRTPVLKLDYQVVEEDIEGIKILPLVLISFIENAIKHGKLNEEENPLMIHLTVEKNKNFTFFVKNKISASGQAWSSGIGLDNVTSRLKRAYGDKHSLIIDNDGTSYTTKLTIEV
jgi:two-component system, LytTR family, sensor kinase